MTDPSEELKELGSTLSSIEAVVDVDRLRGELADLEQQAADPDLWNDQERAQQVTSRMSYVRTDLERIAALRRRLPRAWQRAVRRRPSQRSSGGPTF